jgi:hypothetical protein
VNCAQAGCPPIPPYPAVVFHCAACHQTFGTEEMFIVHQDWSEQWDLLTCRPAQGLGLVADHHGTWQTPEGLQRRQQDAERLAERRRAS